MKFEYQYPEAKNMEMVEDDILYSQNEGSCLMCGEGCHFIDVDYEGYFCSPECIHEYTVFLQQYNKNLDMKNNPKWEF